MLSYTLLLNFVTDLKACHLHNMAGTFNIASAASKPICIICTLAHHHVQQQLEKAFIRANSYNSVM